MNHTFNRPSTIAALDIGSSKVCCLIAHIGKEKRIEIVGHGYNASHGIKNGIITDINQATLSICNAVESAEQMANERINNVVINVSGEKTCCAVQNNTISLHKNRPVGENDIEKLISKSNSRINAPDMEVVHCLPMNYRIDKGEPLKDPRKIYGESLSLDLLIGFYPAILFKNLASSIDNAHLEIAEKTFSAYASGLSCLVEDEKELGATIIDIGGGTTSIATFANGFPVKFSTIPVGGNNITNDIAWGLTTSFTHAEDLKIRHGCAFLISKDQSELINVYPVGEEDDNSIRQIHKADLINIISPRVEEIFEMVSRKLDDHGLKNLSNHRVVLTGGSAQLPGIRDVAALVLDKQVRIGIPRNIPNIPKILYNPTFSSVLGTLMYALNYSERKPAKTNQGTSMDIGGLGRILTWFKQNF